MAKYMLKKPGMVGDDFGEFGKVYEIKKFKRPIKIETTVSNTRIQFKFRYVELSTGKVFSSKKQIKKKFKKGTFKSESKFKKALYGLLFIASFVVTTAKLRK